MTHFTMLDNQHMFPITRLSSLFMCSRALLWHKRIGITERVRVQASRVFRHNPDAGGPRRSSKSQKFRLPLAMILSSVGIRLSRLAVDIASLSTVCRSCDQLASLGHIPSS